MKKIILPCLLALSLLIAILPAASAAPSDGSEAYSDIAGTWFADAAEAYAYPEIFSDGSGKLHPDRDITRVEFVSVLHNALGHTVKSFEAEDISGSFDDMKASDTGANELADLVTAGIIDAGGSFSPDSPLERDVMIHWIIAALDYMTGGNYAMIMILPAPFDDDADITPDYKNDVVKAVVLHIINGRGGNMLYPKDGATRAEALAVINRLMELVDNIKDDVTVYAAADKTDGELKMLLTIRNNTDEAVTISYTSGQHYDFMIYDSNGESLYTWSADKMFTQQLNKTVIQPGEQLTYAAQPDIDTFDAIRDDVKLLKAYITGTSDDFTINKDGYEAII